MNTIQLIWLYSFRLREADDADIAAIKGRFRDECLQERTTQEDVRRTRLEYMHYG